MHQKHEKAVWWPKPSYSYLEISYSQALLVKKNWKLQSLRTLIASERRRKSKLTLMLKYIERLSNASLFEFEKKEDTFNFWLTRLLWAKFELKKHLKMLKLLKIKIKLNLIFVTNPMILNYYFWELIAVLWICTKIFCNINNFGFGKGIKSFYCKYIYCILAA